MATIELTSPEQLQAAQQAVAATDLASCGLTQRLLKCRNDEQNTIGNFLGRIMVLQEDMLAYMQTGNRIRVAELEEQLAAVVAEGQQAEAELAKATQNVMTARVEDAALESWHSRASVALKAAKSKPLPRFFTPADEQCKTQEIAIAEADLQECLDAMSDKVLGIPFAIQQEQQAQDVVGKLAARAKALRSELAALTGAALQPTSIPDSGTGLSR